MTNPTAQRLHRYHCLATGLSLSGVLFSGYLSAVRLSSGVCAFQEPCSYFLGYPACYTGLALFAILLVVSTIALLKKIGSVWPAAINAMVSALGIVFAGRIVAAEVESPAQFLQYGLGLPTCAYGLTFFALVGVASAVTWARCAGRTNRGARLSQV